MISGLITLISDGIIIWGCHLLREHGVVGDMRDAWPNARLRKNVSLIRTFHGFKGSLATILHIFIDILIAVFLFIISGLFGLISIDHGSKQEISKGLSNW